MSEYTREEILEMIEDNGGPRGLDLSRLDLSGIDLSKETIARELERIGAPEPGRSPLWLAPSPWGINLEGAKLRQAKLERAYLSGAYLFDADLEGANLDYTHLEEAFLVGACLNKAGLFEAHLEGASIGIASFDKAYMCWTHLDRVDLSEASLSGTHFEGAYLNQTRMKKEQLGAAIPEEEQGEYHKAREIYLLLKNNFNQIGRYDDASWAYVKERQMEKKTLWPLSYALECYGARELPKEHGKWSRRVDRFRFYLRHLRWLMTEWIPELLCLYGESPLRVVAWAAAFAFLIFPLLYALFGGVGTTDGSAVTWSEYLRLSLASFATIELANVEAQGIAAQFLRTLEALTGISLLALLMFTLGNRISRS